MGNYSHNKEVRTAVLVCIVSIITFFVNNQVIMPDIMESRNIVTAREMVYDGHWMIPTMNGELRLEKPPLPTWLTAVAEVISPDNISFYRGMAGLAALLLIFYLTQFARHILHINSLISVLLLCTCYNVILMGRTASWDIYCHAFMMGGIYHMVRAFNSTICSWRHFLAAGIFTGLSIMSKGPVSPYALFLPFLISYIYFYRPSMKGKYPALFWMILTALLLGSWWYIYVHLSQADALDAVVQKESTSWINRNTRPWWYYWKFFLETGVWSVLLLTSIFFPLFNKERRESKGWLFSVTWMLASLVLLSLMPEKKSRYLLPLLIPASYVMSFMIQWWQTSFQHAAEEAPAADRWLFRINSGLITLAIALLPVAAWIFFIQPEYISMTTWCIFTTACIFFVIYLLKATVQLRPMKLLGCVTVLFLAAECLVMPQLSSIINNPDMKDIAETRNIKELENIPFYHISSDPMRIEIIYSAHRKIRPLDVTDTTALYGKLPCVLLTHQPIEKVLPKEVTSKIDTEYIGLYDNNRRPKNTSFYRDMFIYHATLLKAKNTKSKEYE